MGPPILYPPKGTVMRKSIFAAAMCLLLGGAVAAHAEDFDFTLSGPNDTGWGTLFTSPSGTAGEYDVTGISGTVDGQSISILPVGVYPPDDPPENDNILYYPTGTYVDVDGISFQLADGTDINLYYGTFFGAGPSYWLIEGTSEAGYALDSFTVTPAASATPEPSSLILLGSGLLGMAGVLRRRRV